MNVRWYLKTTPHQNTRRTFHNMPVLWASGMSIASILLSGCSPIFSPNIVHQMSHIHVSPIDGRMGQKLRTHLQNRLKTTHPLHTLNIILTERDEPLVLNKQGQSSVQHYILKAAYTLSRRRDGCVLGKGKKRIYGVKPMTVSYYSQTVMDQASQSRALLSMAEKLMYAVAVDLNKAPSCGCPILKNTPVYESYTK